MSHKKRLQGLDCKRFHKERKINEKDLAAVSLQCALILGLKTRLQIACTSRLPSVANQLEIYAPAVLLLTL